MTILDAPSRQLPWISRRSQAALLRLKDLLAPSYRPELHYMRGPGPATARRTRRADRPAKQPADQRARDASGLSP